MTTSDGRVVVEQPYSEEQLRRIDRKAARKPRTWDEVNSHAGGGSDATFVRR